MANTAPRTLQYAYTNLHTQSAYMGRWSPNLYENGSVGDEKYLAQIDNAIKALRDRENAFADRFGYSSLEELMQAIHNLFTGDFKADLEVLQRFKSDALRASLHKEFDNKTTMLEGKKVRLILDTGKTKEELLQIKKQLEQSFNFSFSRGGFVITSHAEGMNTVNIGLDWDVPNIKRAVNAIQSKHFVYKTNDSRSTADYRLVEYFKSNSGALVKIVSEKTGKASPYEFRTSPLAYKGTELPKLSEEEASKFGKLINDFIFNKLSMGASQMMKNAIAQVWNQNIGRIGLKFFAGGKNWVDFLVGALGEFVTPVFFYYCNSRLNKNPALVNNFMSLVGQDLNRFKEQKSIDIEIAFLKAAGIQVKNYNGAFFRDSNHTETSQERTIDVNLHPSDIASLASDSRIVPYMVNSYFNTSIAQIPDAILQKFFEYHAYEFLNLAIDDSQIEDRATFYLIGGYLIPGSAILEAAFVHRTITVSNTSIKLKGGIPQGDNESYAARGFTTSQGHTGPNFLQWWSGNQFIGWKPTDNNDLTAYEANILIHTSFTYAALFKAEYKIF